MTHNPIFTRRSAIALLGGSVAATALPAFAQDAVPTVEVMAFGAEDAPVTMVEYASFTCPHCKNFHKDVLPDIRKNYIDTGKVRMIYRAVYFDRSGLWADMLARCGGVDRYFGIAGMIYEKQQEWAVGETASQIVDNLYGIGKLAGLNQEDMTACMQNNEMAQALVEDSREKMLADEINATPTFVINDQTMSNMSYLQFAAEFDRILAE